jgi:hypothetical protein
MDTRASPEVERLGYTIDEAVATGAVANRTALYHLITTGAVKTWKQGRRRLISAESLRDYVRRQAGAEAAS